MNYRIASTFRSVPHKLRFSTAIAAATLAATGCAHSAESSPAEEAAAQSLRPELAAIAAYFQTMAQRDEFSGAVFIEDEGTVFQRGYGLANRATSEPVTLDTRFNLGSIDKFLTRLAVHQLLDAGKLNPNDTVGEIIPDYANADVKKQVTVQHLLDMRAGLGGFMSREFFDINKGLNTHDDWIALMSHKPLEFEPGSQYDYCNSCYLVLGKMIEQVSGMSYDDYIRKYIAEPAGMVSTGLDHSPRGHVTAIGYTRGIPRDGVRSDPLGPNERFLPGRGAGFGGGYSSVSDFARLADALRAGKVLPPSQRESFFSRWPGYETGEEPAGWVGGYLGVSTAFSMWQDGSTAIIFTNRDPNLARTTRDKAFELLGRAVPAPRE